MPCGLVKDGVEVMVRDAGDDVREELKQFIHDVMCL